MKKLIAVFTGWLNRRRFERCQREAAKIIARTKAAWPGCEGVMCAWPPSNSGAPYVGATTGYIRTGEASYFKWGTDQVLTLLGGATLNAGQDVSGFIVVERIRPHRKKTNKEYMNGSGVQSGRVQIFHGMIWEGTIRDNSQISSIPREGTYGTLVDMAGHLGAPGLPYGAYLLDSDYEGEPGEPGKRTVLFERIKLIEG